MRRLAKAHRSTRNHHLHRNARLGSPRSDAMTLGNIRLNLVYGVPAMLRPGYSALIALIVCLGSIVIPTTQRHFLQQAARPLKKEPANLSPIVTCFRSNKSDS